MYFMVPEATHFSSQPDLKTLSSDRCVTQPSITGEKSQGLAS